MKTLKIFIGYAFAFLFMAGIMVSCNNGEKHNDKPHTPLFVYFNPLQLDMSMEALMPYFVNYPTDWTKLGLKNYPMMMTYEYNNAAWGVTTASQYVFLANGRLSEQRRTSFNVGATGFDVISFEYDSNSNLVRIKSEEDGRYKRRHNDDGFIYDTAGRLIRREKSDRANPGTWNYIYEYHQNGVLKSIQPEKKNVLTSEAGITLYKFQFDSLAHLKRLETPKSTNIFLKDINKYKKGESVITFTYADNLCMQAVEKIPIKFDRGTETLTCTSTFTYNSHGDLATWTYSGGVYKSKGNSWRVDDMTFTISYDYVYDEKGNWIQATVTFPTNIDEIPALRTYYKAFRDGFTSNQNCSSAVKAGETPSLTVTRAIDYWDDETIASQKSAKENGQPALMGNLRYKGTDIYGLSGKVKAVNGNEESLKFDQAGNLLAMQNKFGDEAAYQYVTATSYKVEGWGSYVVNIESKDGIRTDICPDAYTSTELDQTYMFDKRNRIISHKFTSHMAYVILKYSYKGDSKYPATMIQEHPEEGNTTYRYTYTKFDKYKNWIERKVSYTTNYDKYDDNGNYIGDEYTDPEEYTEKRTIEYW